LWAFLLVIILVKWYNYYNPLYNRLEAGRKQKRILSYLTIYNDALKYAEEFFHYEMIRAFVIQKDGHEEIWK